MTDEPENFALVFLRKIDAKLDQLTFEVREVKSRLSTMELAISNVSATEAGHYASFHRGLIGWKSGLTASKPASA